MKIMVAAASFSSGISGIQRHALNLVRCLLSRPEISRVDLVVAPWQTNLVRTADLEHDGRLKIHVAEMKQGSLSRNAWYYRKLPLLVSQLQPDLLHLTYPVPINAASVHCPTVLTLHDLYPYEIPENFGFPRVVFNRLILSQCVESVNAIACVSDATMAGLRHYAPASTHGKAVRIYNCVEPEPQRIVRSPIPHWSGKPFLLCVAQHRRNKNIVLLIRAFHRLLLASSFSAEMKLVVVGIEGPETRHIQQVISDHGLASKVVLIRDLSEFELQWCYAHCEALIAPSKTEGFGLPVAEALLVGCRIICSDIEALREIGGPHCEYVALGKGEEDDLVRVIRESLQGPRKKCVPQPHLSVEVLGRKYLNLYLGLLPSRTSQSWLGKDESPGAAATGTQFSEPNLSAAAFEPGGTCGRF